MAGGLCAHSFVRFCLIIHALHVQVQSLRARDRSERDEGASQKLAVCITGGFRTGDQCAETHVRSIVEASRKNFDHITLFFATWEVRQCKECEGLSSCDVGHVNETFIRSLYPQQDMDVWIGNEQLPEFQSWADKADFGDPATWPYERSYFMYRNTHNMVTLWKQCMDMVPDDYSVIVRIRPDMCLPRNYKVIASPNNVTVTWRGKTDVTFTAHLDNESVFLPKSLTHAGSTPEVPDDRFGFGLAQPMKKVYGTLVQRADQGYYDVSDAEYEKKWGKAEVETGKDLNDRPQALLNPKRFWVRERHPEKLLGHHIISMNINYTFLPERLGLLDVDIMRGSQCKAPP